MDIYKRTISFINDLIMFKLQYDVLNYIVNKTNSNWRDFEDEQHCDYPIKGCGLIATPEAISKWNFRKDTLLHYDENLAPEETGSEIDSFPRASVSIVYIFSLLEAYGNDVCKELKPNYIKKRHSWHNEVNAGIKNELDLVKNFCVPFGIDTSKVNLSVVKALVELKRIRNDIVHNMKYNNNFVKCFEFVVVIACSIYFGWSGSKAEIKVFPWEDFHGKYKT